MEYREESVYIIAPERTVFATYNMSFLLSLLIYKQGTNVNNTFLILEERCTFLIFFHYTSFLLD